MTTPIATIFTINLSEAQISTTHADHQSHQVPLLEHHLQALELDQHIESKPNKSGATCNACGITSFSSIEEQRLHYKTDWHRFNVKRRVTGIKPITEEDFNKLIENGNDADEVGSLSGSDTSSDDDDNDIDDDEIDDNDDNDESAVSTLSHTTGPQFIFSLPNTATKTSITSSPDNNNMNTNNNSYFGVWRCLVAPDKLKHNTNPPSPSDCLSTLRNISQSGGTWAIILSRGGHFAAAIIKITPPPPPKHSSSQQSSSVSQIASTAIHTICHKSFHTYVVRAKAGGKQSSKDATGKYARSAGSRLRRHNEARLEQDIKETLTSWKKELDDCSLILISAPGSNQKVLFSGDSPLLNKNDVRVRKIPLVTRRPTASEVQRIARVLLTVYSIDMMASSTAVDKDGDDDAAGKRKETKQEKKVVETSTDDASALLEQKEREEAARKKKAEKKARQKQKQKEQRQAEAIEQAEAAKKNAEDEISKAAMMAMAKRASSSTTTSKFTTKTNTTNSNTNNNNIAKARGSLSSSQNNNTSTTINNITSINNTSQSSLSALRGRPSTNEDAATRRARLAAAAEARAKALQQATASQQYY